MGTGQLYIDGNDAYLKYGLRIVQGGYDELVALPPLKAPAINDWHEEDGIEADLENPVLNSRQVTVRFVISGIFNHYGELLELLADRAYHTFEFAEIRRTYRLRLIAAPQQQDVWDRGLITFKFADDFPTLGWEENPKPSSRLEPWDDYYIDGKDIAKYGIRVLKGTRAEIQKMPAVKQNLQKSSRYTEGAEYDNGPVTFKSKDVKIACLMRAGTLEQMWRNCRALLHDLIQPEERTLYSKQLEQEYTFFYKNCKVLKFDPEERWLQFILTITITGDARPDTSDGFILVAENHDIINTETAGNAISLTPDSDTYPSCRFVNNRHTLRFTASGNFRFNN